MKKKKTILISGICLTLFIILVIIVMIIINGTGAKKYYSNILKSNIEIPKYSFSINELQSEDTYQLEFVMFGKEEHIVKQLYELYDNNDMNKNIGDYEFSQWAVNDNKINKLVVIVYEK